MNLRIVRVDPHQAGLVAGIVYAILGLLAVPILLATSMTSAPGQSPFGPGFALAMPILYSVAGYVGTAIACWLFNLVARRLGGVTLSFVEASG